MTTKRQTNGLALAIWFEHFNKEKLETEADYNQAMTYLEYLIDNNPTDLELIQWLGSLADQYEKENGYAPDETMFSSL
jgi:hypothetical protein